MRPQVNMANSHILKSQTVESPRLYGHLFEI